LFFSRNDVGCVRNVDMRFHGTLSFVLLHSIPLLLFMLHLLFFNYPFMHNLVGSLTQRRDDCAISFSPILIQKEKKHGLLDTCVLHPVVVPVAVVVVSTRRSLGLCVCETDHHNDHGSSNSDSNSDSKTASDRMRQWHGECYARPGPPRCRCDRKKQCGSRSA